MRAPLPSNEIQRLEVLRQCQILGTPPELEFDDPACLAAHACAAPVAWLALVDAARVFLKARVNCPFAEMPREAAPCAHALLAADLFVVPDLCADPRFEALQIGAQTVRFYAAAPLVTHDGCALGTLAVLDFAPRALDEAQRESLRALARQATLQLEWRRHAFKHAERLAAHEDAVREDDEHEDPGGAPASTADERFHNAFEHAVIGMALLGLDGRFLTVNPSLCGIAGYTAQELLATNFQTVTHPDDLEHDLEQMRQMLEGEILSYEVERRLAQRRGSEAWVLLSVSLVRDGGGAPLYFLAQVQDITKRKQAESELHDAHEKLKAWVGELERRTTEMSLVGEMGEFLQSCRSVSEAYKIMARTIRQLFPEMSGALCAFDPTHDQVEAVLIWGKVKTETFFSPDDCWGLRRNRMHVAHPCDDGVSELLCPHMSGPLPGSYICLPLTAQRETLGLLHLMAAEEQRIAEDRQQLARTVAEQIALALANLQLQERLRDQSIRDPLTGLFNRRYLEESLEREINRAQRGKRPLGLIMLDIDFFKKFNDAHGHDAGDAVLREVAVMLGNHLRKADIACRYGGEEFTLILPEADASAASQKAEQLREAAKRLTIQYGRKTVEPISLSLGVASFPAHGAGGEALLQAADAALYRAKAAGRDCVMAVE